MFIHSGWYFSSMLVSSGVTRMGIKTGTRLPMRMISICGISRRLAEQLFENFGRHRERVAAREQHIAHLRVRLQIFDLHLELGPREGRAGSPTMRERVQ
jgi:hypothetical protein